jgi:hypothetical protein
MTVKSRSKQPLCPCRKCNPKKRTSHKKLTPIARMRKQLESIKVLTGDIDYGIAIANDEMENAIFDLTDKLMSVLQKSQQKSNTNGILNKIDAMVDSIGCELDCMEDNPE